MEHRFAVLVKQVPDTAAVTPQAMKPDGTLNRAALPAVFNPEDLNALELALQLRERFGGSVCALTMGPPASAEILRQCRYCGADRVVLLTDRCFAGSDTLATSAVLSRALQHLGGFDVVLCGRQAIDGNTAQVGPQVAEKLGIDQITYVEAVDDLTPDFLQAWREVETGRELVRSGLPVLLTVIDTANEVRPPSAKQIMRCKRARSRAELPDAAAAVALQERGLLIEQLDCAAIGMAPERCGLSGSPTRVKKIESVVRTGRDLKQVAPTEAGINEMLLELMADYTFE